MQNTAPSPMTNPFTTDEIKAAVRKLKNNKSPGKDGITSELIKHAPDEILTKIAEIYNTIAETGEHPNEITHGLLRALQKPGKPKGPLSNLRPIILLSILRKILAICLMKRIGPRIDQEIPINQAAYRKNRSTTEHVLGTKLIIERTITSKNEIVYLILLDMSKAFDSVHRATLIEDLRNKINIDELHLVQILLNVNLAAKCGEHISEYFQTDTGAPQGDCASANEFTYYLAKSLEQTCIPQISDHIYHKSSSNITTIPDQMHEHNYSQITQVKHIDIDQQYADDISKITSNYSAIEELKEKLPHQLAKRGLILNRDKTEEYTIRNNSNCDKKWKKWKLLGSLLDTENDITRRKYLAMNAVIKLKHIFDNKKISISTKVITFNSYIQSIFLYNSELWTITKQLSIQIDSFQRKLIRTFILNVKWPIIVKNEDVYEQTKISPLTKTIKYRRLKWFSKLARLDPNTPVRQGLTYALSPYKKPRGRPQLTWLSMMKNELESFSMTWDTAFELAKNEKRWSEFIKTNVN